jgi:hypothetical protein
MCRAADDSIV